MFFYLIDFELVSTADLILEILLTNYLKQPHWLYVKGTGSILSPILNLPNPVHTNIVVGLLLILSSCNIKYVGGYWWTGNTNDKECAKKIAYKMS